MSECLVATRLLDTTLGRDTDSLARWRAAAAASGKLGEELDRGNLGALTLAEHVIDDREGLLDIVDALVLTKLVLQLSENIDRGLVGTDLVARGNGFTGLLDGGARRRETTEQVESIHLGLLERDFVGSAWITGLDDIELAQNQVDLAALPESRVVRRALVVLATEERPVPDSASAGLVATKVVRDDLARQVEHVLTSLALRELIVHTDELAVDMVTDLSIVILGVAILSSLFVRLIAKLIVDKLVVDKLIVDVGDGSVSTLRSLQGGVIDRGRRREDITEAHSRADGVHVVEGTRSGGDNGRR